MNLAPTSLSFGNENVGKKSAPQTATLSNTGNGTLTISSIMASGDFTDTNTCGSTVLAGASCMITVTFTPTMEGARSGSITVTDNANPSMQTVSLMGTGVATLATLSPTSLAFGNQKVGTMSKPKNVTLTNTGNANLKITSISISGLEFSETNTCKTSLAPGKSCKISVVFAPTSKGSAHATVVVKDNASPGQQQVPLTGNGT